MVKLAEFYMQHSESFQKAKVGRKLNSVKYPNIFIHLDRAESLSFNLSSCCREDAVGDVNIHLG